MRIFVPFLNVTMKIRKNTVSLWKNSQLYESIFFYFSSNLLKPPKEHIFWTKTAIILLLLNMFYYSFDTDENKEEISFTDLYQLIVSHA